MLDKFYYKKKCNKQELEIQSLKVEIYDLQEKIKIERLKNKSDRATLEKIKKLPREIKKEYELV